MDFNETLYDLAYAAEAMSNELKGDYKSAAKAAAAATKQVNKLMKAGQYQEAAAACDEAIANLQAFKARLQEAMPAEGEEGGEPQGSGAAKTVVKAVLATVVAVAAVLLHKKFGGKVAAKVAGSDKLASAQSKVAHSKVASKARDAQFNRTGKQMAKIQAKMDKAAGYDRGAASPGGKKITDEKARKKLMKLQDKYDESQGKQVDMITTSRTATGYKERNVAKSAAYHSGGAKDYAKTAAKAAGVAGVGSGVVAALTAFIKGKSTPESMMKAIDASISTLESLKATALEAARGGASESVIAMAQFYEGILEAAFNDENEFIFNDFTDMGFSELEAVEAYVSLADIIPFALESIQDVDDYDYEYEEQSEYDDNDYDYEEDYE